MVVVSDDEVDSGLASDLGLADGCHATVHGDDDARAVPCERP
jgi:hypothetical protein